MAHVPPERKPERGYICQNHPFTKPPFCLPAIIYYHRSNSLFVEISCEFSKEKKGAFQRPCRSVSLPCSVLLPPWISMTVVFSIWQGPWGKEDGSGLQAPPPRILQNLWGSAGRFHIGTSLLKKSSAEPLGAKPSFPDPANSSPNDWRPG